ncbi:unnamed protein product [Amoebophrya sp. A25]|nr:unnamed protein product [Amoebophrya sp. A25]|eukprot:GSA25T00014854001.1
MSISTSSGPAIAGLVGDWVGSKLRGINLSEWTNFGPIAESFRQHMEERRKQELILRDKPEQEPQQNDSNPCSAPQRSFEQKFSDPVPADMQFFQFPRGRVNLLRSQLGSSFSSPPHESADPGVRVALARRYGETLSGKDEKNPDLAFYTAAERAGMRTPVLGRSEKPQDYWRKFPKVKHNPHRMGLMTGDVSEDSEDMEDPSCASESSNYLTACSATPAENSQDLGSYEASSDGSPLPGSSQTSGSMHMLQTSSVKEAEDTTSTRLFLTTTPGESSSCKESKHPLLGSLEEKRLDFDEVEDLLAKHSSASIKTKSASAVEDELNSYVQKTTNAKSSSVFPEVKKSLSLGSTRASTTSGAFQRYAKPWTVGASVNDLSPILVKRTQSLAVLGGGCCTSKGKKVELEEANLHCHKMEEEEDVNAKVGDEPRLVADEEDKKMDTSVREVREGQESNGEDHGNINNRFENAGVGKRQQHNATSPDRSLRAVKRSRR